jgi:hypothetical protein
MMPDPGHGWSILKRTAVSVGLYVVGWIATALVFLFANGSGIEGQGNDVLPYYAVFATCFGLALGWWWIIAFPLLQFYVVEPIWNAVRYEGPIHYAYDRPTFVLLGTLGILVGVASRMAYERVRQSDALRRGADRTR